MDITEIRKKIDSVDDEIVKLFCDRMELCGEVAEFKTQNRMGVLNKSREREVLCRVTKEAGEDMEGYVKVLFSTLFDLSRSYQHKLTTVETDLTEQIRYAAEHTDKLFPQKGVVACQGVEGAYSQIACDKLFALPDIMYFRTFSGVFNAVEKGLCEFGVLPIENSSYGSVNQVYDLMRDYNFHIIRSIKLRIDHNLLAKPGVKLSDVKEVFSHEQGIGQCSEFFRSIPGIKLTVCENTATAAKMVAESDRLDVAAVSSHNCAELYGLSVISDRVQNSDSNYTRFICIAKDLAIYPGANRISLMLTVPHKPGALYSMISKFAALGLNLTKLESRPIAGSDFEFMFYFDLDASVWSPDVIKLLGELSQGAELFVFLGSYSEI